MAINASIPLGVQPVQFENPVNQLAKVLQIKDMQQGQQMNALKMDEYRRGIEDKAALRTALSAPDADPYRVLLQRGDVKGATDFLKGQKDVAKTEAETKAKQIEAAHKRVDLAGQTMGWLRQNPSVENAQLVVNHLVTNGGMDQAEGQALLARLQANPQGIAQFAEMTFRSALAAKEQLPKFQTNNIGGQTVTQQIDPVTGRAAVASAIQNTQSPDNAASVAATMRGQNMTDARARELAEIQRNQPRGQFIETTNGYVLADPKTGAVRPVLGADGQPLKGKAADRQMTDAQAKANLFGSRMSESHRILTELEGKYSPMAVNAKMGAAEMPLVGGVAGYAGNIMLSQEGQQAEQAQRDFINAVLRRESGAVISPAEFSNGQKQYFPQPGDNKAVLDQKRRNRELAIRGMEAEVPGGFRNMPSLTSTGQQGGGGRSASGKVIDFGDLK